MKITYVQHNEEYGKLININDITVDTTDNEGEKIYSQYNPNSKYIYLNKVYAGLKEYGQFVYKDNIDIGIYNSEKEAYDSGCNTIKEAIKNDFIRLYNSLEYFSDKEYDNINYEFTIFKVLINRHNFKPGEELDYYNQQLKNVSNKEDLYELLLDISGGIQINSYDYNGNLIHTYALDIDAYEKFSFKSLLGYHASKFKIGDKVKFKYANNKANAVILDVFNSQETTDIYHSKDPYHYKKGYTVGWKLEDNYISYNDNGEEPYFDEDLEESSYEEDYLEIFNNQ